MVVPALSTLLRERSTDPAAASSAAARGRVHSEGASPDVRDRPHGGDRRATWRRRANRALRAARGPLTAVVLSSLAAGSALRVWDWRPGTPVDLSGDGLYYASQVRAALDGSAWGVDTHLGAPFGQVSGFFPTDDDLHLLLVRALGLFSDSPFTVAALYFLLSFPATALTAYWLARRLGTSTAAAVVVGVLFSVVPGHQTRYTQLFFAEYWTLPLGVWLAVTTARGGKVLRRVRGTPPALRRAAAWWNARSLLIIVVAGLTGIYYAVFALLLLTAGLALRALRRPVRADLYRAAVPLGLLLAVTATGVLRSRWSTHGELVTGLLPARRTVADTEFFSGKLLDLVLPWTEHRDPFLARLTAFYHAAGPGTAESAAIGVVATLGCLGLLVVVARAAVGRVGFRPTSTVTALGVLMLVCLLFYVRGGASAAVALFLTPQLRTWSRLFVLVALIGLLAVGLGIDRLRQRRGPVLAAVVCVAAIAVGVWDQTNPAMAPDWAAQRRALATVTAYTDRLTAALPAGCGVFEAPVVRYPENGPLNGMGDYVNLLPSLEARTLRWSAGAMQGTARADWQLALPQQDPATLVDDLAAAGFCAVQVDRDGYAGDDPTDAVGGLLGAPIANTADGHLSAFDLRQRRDALVMRDGAAAVAARGDAVLHPVVVQLGDGASQLTGDARHRQQWVGSAFDLVVGNLASRPRAVTVDLRFVGADARPRTVRVRAAGTPHVTTTAGLGDVRVTLTAQPGATHVTVLVDGPAIPVTDLDGARMTGRLQILDAATADPQVHVGAAPVTSADPVASD